MRSVLDIVDLSVSELDELITTAADIKVNPAGYRHACDGLILATLFYEPSTRTRLSFESAMNYLGGRTISMPTADSSSAAKGESVADTIRVVENYSDIIAMRHPKEGAAEVASEFSAVPIINGGDGGHWHPTQTLADLLTVYEKQGRLSDLTIGLCGDLKYGRTVHSLVKAMARYEGIKFIFISPEELRCPSYVTEDILRKNGIPFEEVTSLEDAIPDLDILYMTRIQRERFEDKAQYERLKDSYILTAEKMKRAKDSMTVMHPLPRVNEISVDVDDDPRACYFLEVGNGRYMRMALMLKLLYEAGKLERNYILPAAFSSAEKTSVKIEERLSAKSKDVIVGKHFCKNPRCICTIEQEIKRISVPASDGKGGFRCFYCEEKVE